MHTVPSIDPPSGSHHNITPINSSTIFISVSQEELHLEGGAMSSQAENAKMELERPERFSDPEVIKAVVIASEAYKDVKDMKMEPLQQEYADLKVAHFLSQETFIAEIHDEKVKSKALQEELDQLQTSYEELSSKYEGDDALVRQEAETQTFYEEQLSEEQRLLENGRAEKEMFQEMSQKFTFLQDREKRLQEELSQIKSSYDELNCKYESDVFGLKRDVERYQQKIQQEETTVSRETKENLIHEINYSALQERSWQHKSQTNSLADRYPAPPLCIAGLLYRPQRCRTRRSVAVRMWKMW
ncbi:hypothetical protein CCH79_00011041 [Gambusia affinis]|uniref:Uncharacterized protein n=1 Tax=Gambusia affinis TaxID=33528 RepID=A0A315UT53_GAMAF|nr:hypothetical protein CCH79_00011041 [Gambusia affinis]